MGVLDLLKNGAVTGIMAFLDNLLTFLHGQFIEGKDADDEVKKGLACFVAYYPELKQAAARSDNNIDDTVVEEVRQYAEAQLPATLVSELKGLYGPEDVTPA